MAAYVQFNEEPLAANNVPPKPCTKSEVKTCLAYGAVVLLAAAAFGTVMNTGLEICYNTSKVYNDTAWYEDHRFEYTLNTDFQWKCNTGVILGTVAVFVGGAALCYKRFKCLNKASEPNS